MRSMSAFISEEKVFLAESFLFADVPPLHLAKSANMDSDLHVDYHCQV